MYKNKKDVDKHVENLLSKLTPKEFKTRAFSIARLYFEVGDYLNCQKYVEQYLTQKDNNAAAFKLLGQALQKLGHKEKALEHFSTSLDIDPAQTSTILDVCELLADNDVVVEPGIAKFWCERAEAAFPRHPIIFRLQERLATISNTDPDVLTKLLTAELEARPKDVQLHVRLLKHYLHINKVKEAFEHSCNIEFSGNTFLNYYAWYETLVELLKYQHNGNDWLFQLFLLTVREKICMLSLTETPSGTSKSLVESCELLHAYDQAIESVAKLGPPSGFGEFHASLIQHHRGQFALHAATYLLKKAKKDQLGWRDATKLAAPLMLIAWHTVPLDPKVNWLKHSPERQMNAVIRWYSEGTYRCSQSGHYLLQCTQDRSQTFLDQISQYCSGTHWKAKLYENIFTRQEQLIKLKSSHFVSDAFATPPLRLPRRIEVEAYDADAQKQYGNSLHHFVWMLMNYKNYAQFKCTLFDMLKPTKNNGGPETLNKLDIYAFLFCSSLTAQQQKSRKGVYISSEKPNLLPASITDLLCSLTQMKWWDCVYKFCQNGLGTELTDIRSTLSRGIEVVRCVDNHGLDPELLCILGHLFDRIAQSTTNIEEKTHTEKRAQLYYSSAIPILEKLKSKMSVQIPEKRMFDYIHKELGPKELNTLIEESKLYVAVCYFNDCEYDKVIEILSCLTSPKAYYYLGQTYKNAALEENNESKDATLDTKSRFASLMRKAKSYAYKALNKLKETETSQMQPLYVDTQELIEGIQIYMNKMDMEFSDALNYDADDKYLSDDMSENPLPIRFQHLRNISSTPKLQHKFNSTNYRTAVESHTLNRSHLDQQVLERIESEIKNLHKRESTINEFMEQTRNWFDENRRFGNQIMSTIHSDIQNTTDQFKLLKISIDQVKDQIDACRNECKDVGELKKQIAELKKEVNKLKKSSSEQTINEGDLYNLEDEYRTNESTSAFTSQLPFTPSQVIPPLNQRLMPPFHVAPNPYQLYGQSLYNLYNQYSQFAQPTSVAQPIFDPTRPQVNYSGVYPNPDQMYLDVAHLVPPPNVPTAPIVPNVQIGHTLQSTAPTIPVATTIASVAATITVSATPSSQAPNKTTIKETREISRSLPVNVVITSSDPLPTCTTAPAPILSVTIPSKHIKGSPHNYQIQMPSVNDSKVITPPIFSFPLQGSKSSITTSTVTSSINWNQTTTFNSGQISAPTIVNSLNSTSPFKSGKDSLEGSRTVVDGISNTPNTSLNKSRTLSERSNTSVENYDPCPDFKPIVPLPAEVKVRTGEEDEKVIFASRAKLFRFIDKQWKERGLGEIKLLKHNATGKVRVLMRREQIHKICANHIISGEMEIKPMKNETKAYFWVANDFADETVVLEKFCIRFKTADIARDFYTAFEKARQECSATVTEDSTIITETTTTTTPSTKTLDKVETPIKEKNEFSFMSGKAVVGGFTFSSTPTFKPVLDSKAPDTKTFESTPASKGNVFSSLTFKTTVSSAPLNNIFNVTSATAPSISAVTLKEDKSSKLNISDTVEEFEPTVEFRPVVPLPALIDQKTGEEDETVLFEHRAKLLRLDLSTKEWKERGLGNIKLLLHKENNQKVRLLMRREQIMKVCCNHSVTKDMIFQKMANMDKAVTWCAKDFSEGELMTQTFCLRFKTVQTCDAFVEAINLAQSKMKDESKAAKEEQNVAKQNNQSGFGDKFKPKEGSWNCQNCFTNNLESFLNCGCCEQPKLQTSINQTPTVDTTSKPTTDTAVSSGWGDAFKSKPGSWECKVCFVHNDDKVENCIACENPKDSLSAPKQGTDNTRKFNFSIPQKDVSEVKKESTPTPAIFGWGDQFKPKEGTWECKNCLIRNESNTVICNACKISKDPVSSKTDTNTVKFQFGIPPSNVQNNGSSTSIFDGTGTHKFKFGIPSTATDTPVHSNTENLVNQVSSVFTTPKVSTNNEEPLNFTIKKNDDDNKVDIIPKPSLLPTPQADSHVSFGSKENGTFSFVFKPKTHVKSKSPIKSPKSPGDESDNEYVAEDEGHHIHFNPVIPMPDKVEVITGEENEIELYGHRAKLYRFIAGEWKERGIGIVKILKHKETDKLRVVMRREQVLKICLNHAFTPEITYTPKDEKTWLFAANDFSEGELSLQQFCLRFASKEIALEFKNAVDKAREGKPEEGKDAVNKDIESKDNNDEKDTPNDDVIFVSEITASMEEKQKAKELMLPENFYTYKNKEPCQGCRGCKEDNGEAKLDLPPKISIEVTTTGTTPLLTTPVKSLTTPFQSPTSSMYGTPSNPEKTFDTSIFRTPLSTTGSNTKSIVPPMVSFMGSETNKENTFNQNASIFARSMDEKAVFETQHSKASTLFGAGDSQTTNTKTSLIAPPKLNISTTPPKSESTETKPQPEPIKPVFSDAKSLFGNANLSTSSNKSIFDYSNDKKADNSNGEIRSIFGEEIQKSVNIFGSSTPGSIFGSGAVVGNIMKPGPSIFGSGASSTFGALASQNKESDKSIFGNTEQKLVTNTAVDKKFENIKDNKPLFESSLSYEALSSTASDACFQKKADFQWEGAGQQLFGGTRKSPGDGSGDKAKSESGAGDDASKTSGADEEFDPHYEPIVPLPDKIVVTTGEEDEQKLFGERCKLFRYDHKTREWKERGVGELKILYHPEKNTFRLLLRREQVLKAVLNMLLFMDLEMLPMKTSDRAWTFVGMNYAEMPSGEQETLAVRFKSIELANTFHEKVTECIRKLQAAAANTVKEAKEAAVIPAPLLRLPKHLEDSARADSIISSKSEQPLQSTATVSQPPTTMVKSELNVGSGQKSLLADYFKQVHFQEPGVEDEHYEDEEDYEHDYDHNDYEGYYNEEEEEDEESAAYYSCDGEAVIKQGDNESKCEQARIIVTFDQEIYSPKILVTDAATGEVMADMLIHTDTEFQLSGETCTWSGTDFTSNDPVEKTVSVNFYDSDIAMRFYDSCETSKAATYSSTDPES